MIPFSPPRIDDKIINEVVDTLKSGWITTGPKTKLFEQKLTEYTSSEATIAVNSATAGLELMLRWFGVGPGDEVIVPAYTFAATANVVIHTGARPVFVDCNITDFNISIEEISRAISSRTKVIIPVDFAGFPCDYDEIFELVNLKKNKDIFQPSNQIQKELGRILILADAAHSLGAVYKNKKIGSVADITVFSFHAVKNLTTAEGGAICLNLPKGFDNLKLYISFNTKILHGQNKDALSKFKLGNWEYDIVEAGYKANMTDIQASIGLVELERYESDTLLKRNHIFQSYTRFFENYSQVEIPLYMTQSKRSSCHVFALRVKGVSIQERDSIIQKIFNNGVSVNVHFKPLPLMSYYKSLGYDIKYFPNAYDNYSREISLPVFYDLTDENIEQVIQAVINSINN